MTAPVSYKANFIAEPEKAFTALWNELDWEKRSNRRIEYWTNIYDRPYTYGSGEGARTYFPRPTHPAIESVTDALEKELGFRYEACFLNGYEGARNGLTYHADDDPKIDHSRPIAVVTLYDGPVVPEVWNKLAKHPNHGNPRGRVLQVKPIGGGTVESFNLAQGSLLLMAPGMQSTHLHQIPKSGFVVRPRISLTYRGLKPDGD